MARELSDGKLAISAVGFGIFSVILHFAGSNYVPDPKASLLLIVTPGLIVGYYIYRKWIEHRIFRVRS